MFSKHEERLPRRAKGREVFWDRRLIPGENLGSKLVSR